MKLALSFLRPAFGAGLACLAIFWVIALPSQPAHAQGGIPLIRDTEVERVLRSYQQPLLVAGGLDPAAVKLYIVNDPSLNAFVAEGQNMFINTGTIMQLDTPNEITGVMAHETGHIIHGDLVRAGAGIRAATIPLLVSMAVGIAAIIAGAGNAGAAIMMGGEQIAERTFLQYTRTQESNADQAGVRLLTATHQSGEGMLKVFQRFEGEEVLSSQRIDKFAQTHPVAGDRIAALQDLVDASPYRDVKDTPEAQYAYDMIRAKLRGYIQRPDVTLRQYPKSDTSKPARYARAMAYFKEPDMAKALTEIQSLLKDEPNNPYFLEMYGQALVEMGKVEDGLAPYGQAVAALPDAPLIRAAYGAAMLETENPKYTRDAADQLEKAVAQDQDDSFAWYYLAQAYDRLGQHGKAELDTAERYFEEESYQGAMRFAVLALRDLPQGSVDAEHARDIVASAGPLDAAQRQQ